MTTVAKLVAFILVGLLILILGLFGLLWIANSFVQATTTQPKITYGVTFSTIYTQNLNLHPETVYRAILTDLNVKLIRLPIYWNTIESSPDRYDFSAYDRMLDMANQNQVQVILAVGQKLPRWPECFIPPWASLLSKEQLQERVTKMLIATVTHFKNRPEIISWQVENEPLFPFGRCDNPDVDFLSKEVSLVRSLDSRPIIITDSGEVGGWVTQMELSDQMGTSVYRNTWNPIFGPFHYPLPPLYYTWKANLIKTFFAPHSEVFVSELQAEPWTPGTSILQTPIQDQIKGFTLPMFQDSVRFANQTFFATDLLWGAEWWYYMKEKGHPEYWNYAKTLFRSS